MGSSKISGSNPRNLWLNLLRACSVLDLEEKQHLVYGWPLDADIRGAVRPPFEAFDRERKLYVPVFYAYRHVEGVVTRHRLEFSGETLSRADVQVVGRMIGAPTITF